MSKAILVTGQLRFKDYDYFNKYLNKITSLNMSIFICTYKSFQKYAEKLTSVSKICYYDDFCNHYKKLDTEDEEVIMQWIHLDILIKKFKVILNDFDVLYRVRTDILFSNDIFLNFVEDNYIYQHSDLMFYGKTGHFLKTFENFYNDIYEIYYGNTNNYIPLNYENIMKLENVEGIFRWHWINFPEIIWDSNFLLLKQNIQKYIFEEKINPSDYKVKINGILTRIFSSEKSFLINCISYGLIKSIKGEVKLLNMRKQWQG